MRTRVGRNDPCPCGSGKKYKRCCIDRDRVEAPATRRDQEAEADEILLVIETDLGVALRRIPGPAALRLDAPKGIAVESATQDAASLWGLPDFVFPPAVLRVASGCREIGDRLIVVGALALVVQVKTREAPTSDVDKERRWLERHISDGVRQAEGTIRFLQREQVQLPNARGRLIEIDGNHLRWVVVVVLDHPDASQALERVEASRKHPCVVLIRRDWEFLFDQLKSISAVASYLERVADEPGDLGEEPVRYYQLAGADAEAAPRELHPALLARGARRFSGPLLPMAPVGSEDRESDLLVRMIFEDVATTPPGPVDGGGSSFDETDRLKVLAELDGLLVGQRAEIGRFLLDALKVVAETDPEATEWRLRRIIGESSHLAFGVCSKHSEAHQAAFGAWVQLRHHELQEMTGGFEDATTVGVLLTPRHQGRRPWDTTMVAVSGDLGLDDEQLASYREVWPTDDPHLELADGDDIDAPTSAQRDATELPPPSIRP